VWCLIHAACSDGIDATGTIPARQHSSQCRSDIVARDEADAAVPRAMRQHTGFGGAGE
jgi:hypothetical protein